MTKSHSEGRLMDRAEQIAREIVAQHFHPDGGEGAWLVHKVAAALRSYAEPPRGWKLVPEEPTTKMFAALTGWVKDADADTQALFGIWALGSFLEDYRAMLEAAPSPPTGDGR